MSATAGARAQEPFAWEFDGVVRLTRIGTTYITTTVVLAVAAINTGNNPLYIVVALMLGSLLLSGLASKGGLKKIDVELGGIDEAWAGRPAEGFVRVRNRSRLWSVRDLVLTSEAFESAVAVPALPRGESAVVRARFLFPKRGLAHVHAIDAYTRYPFGFFVKKRRVRVESDVVVFPRLLESAFEDERIRKAVGERSTSPRTGLGTETHSFRDYTWGDSLRHVHWKKSASVGRWITRQTAADSAEALHVVVDPYRPRDVSEEVFEEMISDAATLIDRAVSREVEVTLSLPEMTVRTSGPGSAVPLFRALALLEATREPGQPAADHDSVVFSVREDAR